MALRMWASSTANSLRLSSNSPLIAFPAFSLSRCFSTVLEGLKYTNTHEWVKHDGGVATIGITDHAQDHLGEVVYVDLPAEGKPVTQHESFGTLESVKAASSVNSPISGEVVEANTKLQEAAGVINTSPYEDGWLIKVKPSNASELDSLMGPKEYTKFCEEEDASH